MVSVGKTMLLVTSQRDSFQSSLFFAYFLNSAINIMYKIECHVNWAGLWLFLAVSLLRMPCTLWSVNKPDYFSVSVNRWHISDPWSYLVRWADYLRDRMGRSFHLGGNPQTGSGPPPHQTCLLYCKKALETEIKRQEVSSGETSRWITADSEHVTSQAAAHEDLVSQGVAQNHTDELLVPRSLDVLAAFTAAVGWIILEGEGDPDWFPAWEAIENIIALVKYL